MQIDAVQNHYNLSERGYDGVVDYCAEQEILFVPFFPLRGGGGPALNRIAEAAEQPQSDQNRVAAQALADDTADPRNAVGGALSGRT